jgi:hypothetical protein
MEFVSPYDMQRMGRWKSIAVGGWIFTVESYIILLWLLLQLGMYVQIVLFHYFGN